MYRIGNVDKEGQLVIQAGQKQIEGVKERGNLSNFDKIGTTILSNCTGREKVNIRTL